ncbi:MAG: hypothetical protein VZR54_07865 [Ruminococcus sp.]|nr:hypothetical protein [Ruminococcus sp.]
MKTFYRVKTVVSVLLTVILTLSAVSVAPTVYAAGNTWNPSGGVYDISTEADLFAFRDALDNEQDFEGKEVNLLNDIEISEGRTYTSPCSNGSADVYFFGTFNGNNHTISNLNMVSSDNSTVSFLPFIGDATIKDLTLKDVTIENGKSWNAAFAPVSLGDDKIINCHLEGNCLIKSDENLTKNWNYTAGIIADNYAGSLEIRNCSVGANVTIIGTTNAANYRVAAGILAYIRKDGNNTLISNCENRANVESSYIASGIVGTVTSDNSNSNSLTIDDCINYGNITSSVNGNGIKKMAGILAESFSWSTVYIDRCINHGDITVNGTCATGSGGVAGEVAYCSIQNTYNTGTLTALNSNILGGIVGQFRTEQTGEPVYTGGTETIYFPDGYNSLSNCYNTGSVIGGNTTFVGGICGIIQDASSGSGHSIIDNAYNFGTVSGGQYSGNACAEIQNTSVNNIFSPSGTQCIGTNSGSAVSTSNIGYFTSADIDGTVYPATMTTNQSESISSEPLPGNLLQTLNKWVSDKNAELEGNGKSYRYLTWKMTNPASEDGSKGVTVHPMFGVEVQKALRFHVNEPGATDRLFRVYNGDSSEAEDAGEYTLTKGKVEAFYDIPSFAGDDYVFAGWYYNADDGTSNGDTAFVFDSKVPANVTDVYAHWIAVGEVAEDGEDDKELPNSMGGKYRGFGLAGVQIRREYKFDTNYGDYKPGGLRFITSISEDLLSEIDSLSDKTTNGNKVEYGYVTAAQSTVESVISKFNTTDHPGTIDTSKYKLQYNGTNVNGVDTTVRGYSANNFRYITNVDCTSTQGGYGGDSRIKSDHQNYSGYRLATYVVTYDDNPDDKSKNIAARAYLRYYDANGLLRTFYNDYGGADYYGGCSVSYNGALALSDVGA